MTCQVITLPGGQKAIVCGARGRKDQRCACGAPADLLCDWKTGAGKTCDAPICAACTFSPALNKDLCPAHAEAYAGWQARQAAKASCAPDVPPAAEQALQRDLFGEPASSPSTTRGPKRPSGSAEPHPGVRGATPRPRSMSKRRSVR